MFAFLWTFAEFRKKRVRKYVFLSGSQPNHWGKQGFKALWAVFWWYSRDNLFKCNENMWRKRVLAANSQGNPHVSKRNALFSENFREKTSWFSRFFIVFLKELARFLKKLWEKSKEFARNWGKRRQTANFSPKTEVSSKKFWTIPPKHHYLPETFTFFNEFSKVCARLAPFKTLKNFTNLKKTSQRRRFFLCISRWFT